MGLMVALQPSAGVALVVGGGRVAARKVASLRDGGFAVHVVALHISDELRPGPGVTVEQRAFRAGDLAERGRYAVVFACTDDRAVNRLVGELARAAGLLVNVCDNQAESTFFSPATLRRGDIEVAVSTGGASPRLARDVRARVAAALGDDLVQAATNARAERERRMGRGTDSPS